MFSTAPNPRNIRLYLQRLLMGLFLVLLVACSQDNNQDNETDPKAEKPKVALIMKSLANEFFVTMAKGAEAHHTANTERYELIVNGIKDEADLTQQVALVEQMVASGADVIVIAPADSKALIPVLKRARKQGIVVVNIDNKLDSELLADANVAIPFVGPDNREGAHQVGDYLGQQLEPGSEVAIIAGIATAYNSQQRQLGFEDAMASAGMNIVSRQNGDWQQAKASTITAALVTEHPDLKAILCANDSMAIGAAAALKKAGKSDTVALVGFDNISAAQDLIKNGRLLATAEQYGNKLAVYGIEWALKILDGTTPADEETPVDLITAQTLTVDEQ